MMEIGKHCEQFDLELNKICNILDYCPFFCETCRKWSCTAHRIHGCEIKTNKVIKNPIIQQKYKKCPYPKCNDNLVMSYTCPNCLNTYCIKHRHHFTHSANGTSSNNKIDINKSPKLKNNKSGPKNNKSSPKNNKSSPKNNKSSPKNKNSGPEHRIHNHRGEFYGGNQIHIEKGKKRVVPFTGKGYALHKKSKPTCIIL